MEKFSLVLKNDKIPQYDRMAAGIILINFCIFLYLLMAAPEKSVRVAALIGATLLIIAMLVHFFLVRTRQAKDSPYLMIGLWIPFLTWLGIGNIWATVISFLLELLYQQARKTVAVHFYDDRIVYTSFPEKVIGWDQLSHVILKDGLLTLDFRNNKIIQSEITTREVNEREFNEFCSQRLHRTMTSA